MTNDTVTLALDGDIALSDFAEAVRHFDGLITALTKAEGATHVQWVIEQLEVSSAVTTARGIPANGDPPETVRDEIERVVQKYLSVGLALERGEALGVPATVEREARGIVAVLNERVKTVRFETAEAEATVGSPPTSPSGSVSLPTPTYGAVEGRVQTLSSRGGLRFTLYDTLNDKAVSCYLAEGFEDDMRDAWGRRAVVEGRVTRHAETGRPLAVRGITAIDVLPELPRYAYSELRAFRPSATLSAEDAIRRLRDAG
jgi:hypothetical protein